MTKNNNNLENRCVVLVPIDRVDAAYNVISNNELRATIEHEPVLAMAEICLQIDLLRKNLAWCDEQQSTQLILIHTQELSGVAELITAIQKYCPSVIVSELRDGRIACVDIKVFVPFSTEEVSLLISGFRDAKFGIELNSP